MRRGIAQALTLPYVAAMPQPTELLQVIERAARRENTNLIVRSEFAIAEVKGPLQLHCTGQWLRLGVEGQSHLHIKVAEIERLEFSAPTDANAGIKLLGQKNALLCRIVFRHTNPELANFDESQRNEVQRLFSQEP